MPLSGGEGARHGGVAGGVPECPGAFLKGVDVGALHSKLPGVPEDGPWAGFPAVCIAALLEKAAIFTPNAPIAVGDARFKGRYGLQLTIIKPIPPDTVFNLLTLLGLNKLPSLFELSRWVVHLVRRAADGASGGPSNRNKGAAKREDQLVRKRVIHCSKSLLCKLNPGSFRVGGYEGFVKERER